MSGRAWKQSFNNWRTPIYEQNAQHRLKKRIDLSSSLFWKFHSITDVPRKRRNWPNSNSKRNKSNWKISWIFIFWIHTCQTDGSLDQQRSNKSHEKVVIKTKDKRHANRELASTESPNFSVAEQHQKERLMIANWYKNGNAFLFLAMNSKQRVPTQVTWPCNYRINMCITTVLKLPSWIGNSWATMKTVENICFQLPQLWNLGSACPREIVWAIEHIRELDNDNSKKAEGSEALR